MENPEAKKGNNQDTEAKSLGTYGGIAFQMVAVIGLFAFAGHYIDKAAGHGVQWVTAIFSLVGVFIAMYIIFKSLKA